jgi:hypothetical protein
MASSFKDDHRELQGLVRELELLRRHNQRFSPGMSQASFLLMSEAAMMLVTFERFLRILPEVRAQDSEALPTLLSRATGPGGPLALRERDATIQKVGRIRNALLRGNYEQELLTTGRLDLGSDFQRFYAEVLEPVFRVLDELIDQIDTETGKRKASLPAFDRAPTEKG